MKELKFYLAPETTAIETRVNRIGFLSDDMYLIIRDYYGFGFRHVF